MFVCLLMHCFSIDLHVRLWLLTFGCRLYFRLLLCGGPLALLAVSKSWEPFEVCCWSCGGWAFLGSSRPADSSRGPDCKSCDRGVLSLDASTMARWSFCNDLVSILVLICTRVTQNALVDDRVLLQEFRCKYHQIGRSTAAAYRGYLQIRLGDVHERFPCIEAFFDKGIVIARQVQSLEQ